MSTITIKVNAQDKTIAEHKVITQNGKPTTIKAVDQINYELIDESSGRAPNHIVTKRINKDLYINFENDSVGPDLIIEGFYDSIDNALIGVAEDGSYYYYIPDSGEVAHYVTELQMGEVQGQALGGNAQVSPWWIDAVESVGFNALPWLAGLAGVGLLGAALAGGDNNGNNKPSVDITAPGAPTDLVVSKDGSSVTGKGEPDTKVEITDANGDVIGEGVVDANGEFAVDLVPPLVDGEKIEATLTDKAGNTSDPTNATAPDKTAPTAPTTAPVITDNVANDGTNAELAQPETIDNGGVTNDATPSVTVPVDQVANGTPQLVVDGKVVPSTAITNSDGSVTLTPQTALTEGRHDLSYNLKDAAGNVSGNAPNATVTVDTIAPDAPTSITVGNGDAFINAAEIDADGNVEVVIGLPSNAVAGDTMVANGVEKILTSEDILAKTVTVKVPAPAEGKSLDITATLKDAASNSSLALEETVGVIDTTAPSDSSTKIEVATLTDDNVINKAESEDVVTVSGTVTGEFTAGDAVTVTVNGKSYTGVVADDGKFSIDVPGAELVADADKIIEVSVTSTDAAGNTGTINTTKEYTVNTDEVIAAADDFVDLVVDAVPSKTENAPQSTTSFDLVTVGLGPILSADVVAGLGGKAIIFDVGQDQVRKVTMHGDAGGIAIGATSDLYVYKLNESTNQWEQQSVSENWVVAGLLGGKGKDTNFDLTQGKWAFMMAPGEGIAVLTGYSIRVTEDNTFDYSDAESVSGSANGNILTDNDAKFGQDELPAGSVVTSINDTVISKDGPTVIEGQYGKLTIQADGSYEYTVNADFRGPYGSEETFTYIVTSPNGNSSSADLTIQLNIIPAVKRIEIDATVVVDVEPTLVLDADRTDNPIDKVGSFSLVNLGLLGPVLGADILGGKGTMKFSVGENQVRELTFKGDGGGVVSIGVQHDLFIYKLDESTGNFVQVHVEKNWFTTIIGGSISKQLALQFDEGVYRAILVPKGGVNVASGSGLEVVDDKLYDYDTPLTFTGSVTDQDVTEDGSTVLLKVGDQLVEPGQATIVQGQYGKLVINSDGTYSYNVEKPADAEAGWKPPYGKVDSFKLVTQDANGKLIVEKLNIKISTHIAADDFNATTITEQNVTSDISFTREYKSVGNYGNSMEESFEITQNQAASATLKVQTSALNITYTLTNLTTGEVFTKTETAPSKGVSLDIKIDELPAGKYTIEINSSGGVSGGNIKGYQFVTTLVHTDEYIASSITPVTGLLLDNDSGTANISELKIGNLEVFLADANKGAKSIEIEGQYGTLTVSKDGSYQYVPKGGTYGIEKFVYETTSVTGVKETATL